MKTLLLAGALTLALITGAVNNTAALSGPDAQWAKIIHTVR